MTTMHRTMPLAALIGAIGNSLRSPRKREADIAFLRAPGRNRSLHNLSDWVLKDIGLEREDVMSLDARRSLDRMRAGTLW